ncbi:hypothetical protein [Brytella acorum]|uniref:Uncharacterized protein n=1 Tax=Brytella acorum TaxID=2959299 RepID=A0AA35XWW1_9PROT|nr:hypothetical protein [Brytella acorum]MDF3625768.1 hypothetical protein [Brytella acorum]CAI9121281.1 hypothetical protein LMG32879_002128 [Brytella acorum]
MSDKERLTLLIMQGRKIQRTFYGVGILQMCLRERMAREPGVEVDPEWINPALEALDSLTDHLMSWWDDRLDAAEGSKA